MGVTKAFEIAQEEYLKEFPEPLCLSCRFYLGRNKCLAFGARGIPTGFMSGRLEHRARVDGQEGEYVYEPGRNQNE